MAIGFGSRLTGALLVVLGSLPAAPAGAASGADEARLFGPREPLTLRIESAWRELIRRPESGRERDGRLRYTSPAGEQLELDVRLTVRGKTRLELCTFPMLTLELDREQIRGTLFEDDPVVHLTAQCRDQGGYLRYLVHEYLAYRAFALLTDRALGARWLTLEYHGPNRGDAAGTRQAFLVEDIGVAATRLGLEWLHPTTVPLRTLDADACALFALFQYMIGNTDWSVKRGPPGESCCHNVALLGRSGRLSALVPIPFDLDSSGLVNASYSAPDPSLRIRSTRQRVYRGHCLLNPHLDGAISRLNASRDPILALFADDERLKASTRKRTIHYLETFFDTINDSKKLAANVVDRCRPGS